MFVNAFVTEPLPPPHPKASFDKGPVHESHYSEEQIRYEKSCNLLLKRVEELSFVEQHA